MITGVNTELRHNDLPTLENEIGVERKNVETKRDADIEARAQKLEADLAELEAEGAKSDVRRKVKEGGEREMRQLRDRASASWTASRRSGPPSPSSTPGS